MSGRKIIIEIIIFLVLAFNCFGDSASNLGKMEVLTRSGQFNQAESLSTTITGDNTLKAQGKLAASYIMTDKISQADSKINNLIKDFKNNPQLPEILYGMVLRYKAVKDSQRAQNLSQQIVQQFPDSEQAQRIQLDTGKEVVLKHISKRKFKQAEDAVNSMIASSGNSSAMPGTLYRIAKQFKEYEAYDEADRVYQKIAQNYLNSQFGGKAKMAVDKLKIWGLIKNGDIAEVDSATQKLINDYSGQEDLAHTIHGFGIQFEKAGNFAKAKSIYQKVANEFPDNWVAEIAAVDIEMCDVRAMISKSSFDEVMTQLNVVKSKYSGNWHLPKAIRQVGQEYQSQAFDLELKGSKDKAKEFYGNAIAVWDIVVNQLPKSSSSAPACSWSGNCYQRLGDYAKAAQSYQKVADEYTNYQYAWNAMLQAGQCYENQASTGAMSKSDADLKIKAVYQQLVTKFPDCPVTETAQNWLNSHSSN